MRPQKVFLIAGCLVLVLLAMIFMNPTYRQVLQEVNVEQLAAAEEQGLLETKMPLGASAVVRNGCEVNGMTVGEIRFKIDGVRWVYRCAAVGEVTEPLTDISETGDGFAQMHTTQVMGCPAEIWVNGGENGKIIWMDPVGGGAYSLTVADDADGDALQGVAAFMHTPLK